MNYMNMFSASLRSSSSSTSAILLAKLSLVCTSGLAASRIGLGDLGGPYPAPPADSRGVGGRGES